MKGKLVSTEHGIALVLTDEFLRETGLSPGDTVELVIAGARAEIRQAEGLDPEFVRSFAKVMDRYRGTFRRLAEHDRNGS